MAVDKNKISGEVRIRSIDRSRAAYFLLGPRESFKRDTASLARGI